MTKKECQNELYAPEKSADYAEGSGARLDEDKHQGSRMQPGAVVMLGVRPPVPVHFKPYCGTVERVIHNITTHVQTRATVWGSRFPPVFAVEDCVLLATAAGELTSEGACLRDLLRTIDLSYPGTLSPTWQKGQSKWGLSVFAWASRAGLIQYNDVLRCWQPHQQRLEEIGCDFLSWIADTIETSPEPMPEPALGVGPLYTIRVLGQDRQTQIETRHQRYFQTAIVQLEKWSRSGSRLAVVYEKWLMTALRDLGVISGSNAIDRVQLWRVINVDNPTRFARTIDDDLKKGYLLPRPRGGVTPERVGGSERAAVPNQDTCIGGPQRPRCWKTEL